MKKAEAAVDKEHKVLSYFIYFFLLVSPVRFRCLDAPDASELVYMSKAQCVVRNVRIL